MRLSVTSPRILLLALAATGALSSLPALADDTILTLGVGDRFVVKDSDGVERLVLDGATGLLSAPAGLRAPLRAESLGMTHHTPAGLLIGGVESGQEKHMLALVRNDIAVGNRVAWLWKGGGAAITPTSMRIDGEVRVDYETSTGLIQVITDPVVDDPDKVAGSLPSMLQIGADVEYGILLRAGTVGCSGCTPARPEPKALMVLDKSGDTAFEMHWNGRMRWGDAGPTSAGTSDGDKGETSFDTALYRVENGADETMEFELDGDDDGNGTRRVSVAHPHPQGTGSAALGGVMVWGNTGVAAIDSGDEVCASVTGGTGLTCQTSLDPTDGSEHACGTPHPPTDATASGIFHALCY